MTELSQNKIQEMPPASDEDYNIIEQALLQNPRGKWFLEEYINRNRPEDTQKLLSAIERIENTLQDKQTPPLDDIDPIRMSILEMADAIAKTREEIKSIKPAEVSDNQFSTATEELSAIVTSTEDATNTILEAAEDIQEAAWVLREAGAEDSSCDRIDNKTTEIYTACSFQDITGQRTTKVVQALAYVENRINAMIEIWGLNDQTPHTPIKEETDTRPDNHLLNGPAKLGEELQQNYVDGMLAEKVSDPDPRPVTESTDEEPGQEFADSLSFDQIEDEQQDITFETRDDELQLFETATEPNPSALEAAIEEDTFDLLNDELETSDDAANNTEIYAAQTSEDHTLQEETEQQNPLDGILEDELILGSEFVENDTPDLEDIPDIELNSEDEMNLGIAALDPKLAEFAEKTLTDGPGPESADTVDDLDLDDLMVNEIEEISEAPDLPEMAGEEEQQNQEEGPVMNLINNEDLEAIDELNTETLSDDQKETLLS